MEVVYIGCSKYSASRGLSDSVGPRGVRRPLCWPRVVGAVAAIGSRRLRRRDGESAPYGAVSSLRALLGPFAPN